MSRSTLPVLLLGLILTALVVAVDLLGGLAGWERATIDARFRHAPRTPRPMTEQIAHVDIDDGALDRLGRWPWDRARLADVVNELARGGAKTVALDLILTETQKEPGSDALLAQALAATRCVLPISIHEDEIYGEGWQGPQGRIEMQKLLDILGADLLIDESDALDRAEVTGTRRVSLVRRPLEFKRAAAWLALQQHGRPVETFEQFEQLTLGERAGTLGSYAERPTLMDVFRQHTAWNALQRHLLAGDSDGTFRDRAPLPEFAAATAWVGFVNADGQIHPDGSVREVAVRLPAPGGDALAFGLAAAAAHLDLTPADIVVHENELLLGRWLRLQLRNGRITLDWPTSDTDPRWEGLLRQTERSDRTAGHISIRALVELAQSRRTIARNRRALDEGTTRVLRYAGVEVEPGQERAEGIVAQVVDEVAFTLADPLPGDTDDEFTAHYRECEAWRRLRQAIVADEAKLREGDTRIQKAVNGKLVFIGWTATGSLADFYKTALGPRTPGVIVHAVLADMALAGSTLRTFPPLHGVLVTSLLGVLLTLTATRLAPVPSTAVALTLLAAFVGVALWAFWQTLVIPVVPPMLAGGLAWVGCTAFQAARSQRDRQRITRQFKARVSTQLVDHLVDHPEAVAMAGEERETTVMFADLAGFTSISESLGGPTSVATLNRYMTGLTRILIEQGAYVNKFLGDGFMAFWSAFDIDSRQSLRACRAALSCQAAMRTINDDPKHRDIPDLELRIGIATGRAVVGDCGAPPALNDYTVIGDTVNLAARLESANKQFGTHTLINGRTRQLIGDRPIRSRPVGKVIVVGQSVPDDVHEVLPDDAPDDLAPMTEAAVSAFAEGHFDQARTALAALERRFGPSPLIEIYREAIAGVGPVFDGILHLRAK